MAEVAPQVSVIIPTRNRAELLRRSVASILAQTFRDFELIVVDDGSTDHTRDVLAQFDDPRIRILHREQGKGAAAARNAGMAIARGRYLSFNDDDDFWLVQKLQRQVDALEAAPDAALCLSGFVCLGPNYQTYVGGRARFEGMDFKQGGGWDGPSFWLISTPSWLVRRETIDKVGGFDERLRSYDDWELGLRITQAARVIHVSDPLWIQDWRRTAPGMAFNAAAHAHDLEWIMEKHKGFWDDQPRAFARHCYIIGRNYVATTSPATGRQWLLRSLRANPWRLKAWLVLLLSVLGPDRYAGLTQRVRSARDFVKRAWQS